MRNTYLLAICAVLILSGCSNQGNIKKLIEVHFEKLNRHDIEKIATDYSADTKINSTGFDDVRTGPAQVKIIFNRYFSSSPDLHYTIKNIIYTDTTATVEYESAGSIPADDFTSPVYMRGKKYTLRNCTVYHIKDDRSHPNQAILIRTRFCTK
ncbi:MAG: nuclear transport factor 2 family protein [Mucilaginibacter sp.]|uniref:nuclear transport factor 2 family protein n=1 Tax=Mucilaginibacter sp. TaxID=1882438 RepID=UPI003263F369